MIVTYRQSGRLMRASQFVGAVLAAAVVGCGADAPPTGTASGTVAFDGNPLTTGTVNFYSKESGTGARGELDEQGRFAVDGRLPTGVYVIFVRPPDPPMPVMTDPNDPPPRYDPGDFPAVPDKYLSDTTSDLTVELKPGRNEFELTIPAR